MSSFLFRNLTVSDPSITPDATGVLVFADGNAGITPEGGHVVKLINKTGTTSVKGTLVETSTAVANGTEIASADSDHPIGVVYNSGVADGGYIWVVISGVAEVLMKNNVASVIGYWVSVSDAAGRATTSQNSPGLTVAHWREIGHSIESKTAGTDVLSKIILHFN